MTPHPVTTGKPERVQARQWQECRAYWIDQGSDPVMAGELAWKHVETGQCPIVPAAVRRGSPVWAGRALTACANRHDGGQETEGAEQYTPDAPEAESGEAAAFTAGSIRCLRCEQQWKGQGPEHCASCCRTFGGTFAGDRHRLGRHGVDRRCATDEELRERGLTPQEITRGGVTWTQWSRAYNGSRASDEGQSEAAA